MKLVVKIQFTSSAINYALQTEKQGMRLCCGRKLGIVILEIPPLQQNGIIFMK
jgi:hypothetical protein